MILAEISPDKLGQIGLGVFLTIYALRFAFDSIARRDEKKNEHVMCDNLVQQTMILREMKTVQEKNGEKIDTLALNVAIAMDRQVIKTDLPGICRHKK